MSLEVAALVEATRADGTFVRRFLHVQDFVNRQGTTLTETLAAFVAFEGFFLAMNIPEGKRDEEIIVFRILKISKIRNNIWILCPYYLSSNCKYPYNYKIKNHCDKYIIKYKSPVL